MKTGLTEAGTPNDTGEAETVLFYIPTPKMKAVAHIKQLISLRDEDGMLSSTALLEICLKDREIEE